MTGSSNPKLGSDFQFDYGRRESPPHRDSESHFDVAFYERKPQRSPVQPQYFATAETRENCSQSARHLSKARTRGEDRSKPSVLSSSEHLL
mmetsp:Transcript_22898/g.54006  ORF Transcript_22898/g.54006 Transcript_22898/m.54006 type:complete len:91 (-) Transcript_22898:572-844(-)